MGCYDIVQGKNIMSLFYKYLEMVQNDEYIEADDDSFVPSRDMKKKKPFYRKKEDDTYKGPNKRTPRINSPKPREASGERQKTIARRKSNRQADISQDTRDTIYGNRKQSEGPKWWEKKSEQANVNQANKNKREKGDARGGW